MNFKFFSSITLALVLLLSVLILLGAFYLYIYNLYKDNCECGINNNYYKYIVVVLALNILNMFLYYVVDRTSNIFKGFRMIIGLLSLINVVVIYKFLRMLEKTNCECAVKKYINLHKLSKTFNILSIILVTLPLTILILLTVTGNINNVSKKK